MKKTIFTVILAGLVLFVACPVQAELVTIQISGEVTSVAGTGRDSVSDTIYAGVPFTGTYTYDSSTLDSDSDPHIGKYLHDSPYGISISLGGYEFKTALSHTDQFRIRIYNDLSDDGVIDSYAVISQYENISVPSDLTVSSISWYLRDSTHTALSSDALPLSAPMLDNWDDNSFGIGAYDSLGRTIDILGTVTQAVPEPLTGILLVTGFFFVRRRRCSFKK